MMDMKFMSKYIHKNKNKNKNKNSIVIFFVIKYDINNFYL